MKRPTKAQLAAQEEMKRRTREALLGGMDFHNKHLDVVDAIAEALMNGDLPGHEPEPAE